MKPDIKTLLLSYYEMALQNSARLIQIDVNQITAPEKPIERIFDNFTPSEIPKTPLSFEEYYQWLYKNLFPFSMNQHSPQSIAHMSSIIPGFMEELAKIIVQLNQNMVKLETAKAWIVLERQTLAMLHRFYFQQSPNFYHHEIKNNQSHFGVVVSDGSLANLTAIWLARNLAFPPKDSFAGIAQTGLKASLDYYGYQNMVILISPLLHYSFHKIASLLGIGINHVYTIPLLPSGQLDLEKLQTQIIEFQKNHFKILALVALAGATETGSIDPIAQMAIIAKKYNIYFHVDAAFAGPLIFSTTFRKFLKGIELADSITLSGHKQFYLPVSMGVCLFRQTQAAQAIYVHADYQASPESFDPGKCSPEGSRPASILYLHGALNLLGTNGYNYLLDHSIKNANYFTKCIKESEDFELVWQPTINIVNYRYIPKLYRSKVRKEQLTHEDNLRIDIYNKQLQEEQLLAGRTLVSKTELPYLKTSANIISLRAVFMNPLTTTKHIDSVLEDQRAIASKLNS